MVVAIARPRRNGRSWKDRSTFCSSKDGALAFELSIPRVAWSKFPDLALLQILVTDHLITSCSPNLIPVNEALAEFEELYNALDAMVVIKVETPQWVYRYVPSANRRGCRSTADY
jgi:hypothetical protein